MTRRRVETSCWGGPSKSSVRQNDTRNRPSATKETPKPQRWNCYFANVFSKDASISHLGAKVYAQWGWRCAPLPPSSICVTLFEGFSQDVGLGPRFYHFGPHILISKIDPNSTAENWQRTWGKQAITNARLETSRKKIEITKRRQRNKPQTIKSGATMCASHGA